ncbi:MAG: glycosyltransferase family A protein, partial [Candidatus Hadarchaeum sp.]
MSSVSVIIPCYNHGHYLPCAVNSVMAQTFADWEAIIVDDGSTDNTREVAAQFTDSRVRYIYQDNRGLAAARNTGIRAAQGEYLAFLDADDEWEPTFLEACVAALSQQPALAAVV